MTSEPVSRPVSADSRPQPEAAIGVFDSGLGGLRVLDRLLEALPGERFVYLGDTAHMPYGEKPPADVRRYVQECLDWLFGHHDIKMMVVACNTASAVAADLFERYPGVPFIDPVTPICQWLHNKARYRHVGVMATPATVGSNRYSKLLRAFGSDIGGGEIRLTQVACDNLATVIEAGDGQTPECRAMISGYLEPLVAADVEAVVLGCTHYPYVMAEVAELLPAGVDVLDPGEFMAIEARRLLEANDLSCPIQRQPGALLARVSYSVTRDPERFYRVGQRMPFQALAMKSPALIEVAAYSPPSDAPCSG